MVSGLVNALRASVIDWTFSGWMSRWTRKQGSSVALGGAPCARTSLRRAPPNRSLAGVTPPCTAAITDQSPVCCTHNSLREKEGLKHDNAYAVDLDAEAMPMLLFDYTDTSPMLVI